MNFQNQSAFITGVAHGIGRAIAVGLAENHAKKLILCDINQQGLLETAGLCQEAGAEVLVLPLDVTDQAAVEVAVEKALKFAGRIDILINNAGVYNDNHLFAESTAENWKRKIDTNIYGTLYPTRALINHMIENRKGHIVNIGSVAGVYGIANMADYSMTKGAIISFTVALAKEVTPLGLNVNCVSPGSIDVTENHSNPMPQHSFKGLAGTPEQCANVVLFLASDDASYVSGQNYLVDGCRKKM